MSNPRILVVEDDQNWFEELNECLQHLKDAHAEAPPGAIPVEGASDRKDAIMHIQKEYDLIIVDLALAGEHLSLEEAIQQGMSLLKVIRQSQNNKNCGLLVLSGHGDKERIKQAFRDYGVHDFLEKGDFNRNHFLETARAAIREARLKRAAEKSQTRLYMTIIYNQDSLIGCELTGRRHASYQAATQQPFHADELIRRADNLNVFVLKRQPDLWRPVLREVGTAIYDHLFREQCFQIGLVAGREAVQHPRELWLQFSGPAKYLGLPFEFLSSERDYLSQNYILTRRVVQSGGALQRKTERFHEFIRELLRRDEQLRILIVGANIENTLPAAEREAMALKNLIESDLHALGLMPEVTLLQGAEATYDRVSKELSQGRYHLFHYAGHGFYNDTLPENSGLVLTKNGALRVLTAADLNTLVSDTELQMVFLNCCLSAQQAEHVGRGDFSGMLEAVASADVPTVLGYRWTVLDDSAMRLAQDFYEALWRTFSPGEALLEARINATRGSRGRDDETWASPVLVMQNI